MDKILILFDGPHLAFSPTPVQLYDELSKTYDVTLIAQDPENFTGASISGRKVKYHKYYGVKGRIFYRLLFRLLTFVNREARFLKQNNLTYRDYYFKYLFIKRELKAIAYKRIICVDIMNLFYCSMLHKKVDFLSLELTKDERLLKSIDKGLIQCVLIQSLERYDYLFKGEEHNYFIVQNAPVFKDIPLELNSRKGLIFAGSAIDAFGFYHCLDYLEKYPDEMMIVQGAFFKKDKEKVESQYPQLLDEGRLIINTEYLDNDDVVKFISKYQVGFCFYNFEDPMVKNNYFNYFTAPSGKLFKYLAAGIPVVCINILGFKFIEQFKCGVLINELDEETIHSAITKIRLNYDEYVKNCRMAAVHFSFDKAIQPYLQYLSHE